MYIYLLNTKPPPLTLDISRSSRVTIGSFVKGSVLASFLSYFLFSMINFSVFEWI
ncbi:hypothetical protein H6G97_38405 [Nostoc flagelliforme FACHB-838]|uniref:Uncharacterized protein n=1 Tax=Nostoc flagelliforme FACHB-838 TaxID=2692904 RepID=A0ABR8E300_9NOSO|nr:hypothetical protein [Nostoc flagelliforme FACHB-838]